MKWKGKRPSGLSALKHNFALIIYDSNMPLKEKLIEKLSGPKAKAFLLRFFWKISLLMLVLGYGIMAYVWFNT